MASQQLRVHTVLYDGVEDQDYIGPTTVFGISDDVAQTFVTVEGPGTVVTSSGVEIVVRDSWSPLSADVIVVPGGGYGEGSGVGEQIRHGVVPKALAEAQPPA